MNLQMRIIEIKIEGENMNDWIDDLINKAKGKQNEELRRDEIRLHKAKVIAALFPAFWGEVLKQIDNDCSRLKKECPDFNYHIHKDSTPLGGIKLTREAAPPFRQISVEPIIDGQCINVSGGHIREVIYITLKGDNILSFTWGKTTYTNPQELSKALIEYCASGE
jgi:hypothetical protein